MLSILSIHFPTREYNATRVGTLPGHASGGFWLSAGGKTYVGLNVLPRSGGSPMLNGWILWAVEQGGAWEVEERPLRWQGTVLSGLAEHDGIVHAMVSGPHGASMWQLSNEWQERFTIQAWPFTPPALSYNATHWAVVGYDGAGNVNVWEQRWGEAQPVAQRVIPASAPVFGGRFVGHRSGIEPLAAAFNRHGLGPDGAETGIPWILRKDNTRWSAREVAEEGREIVSLAIDGNGTVFVSHDIISPTGHYDISRFDGRTTSCPVRIEASIDDPQVLGREDGVEFVFLSVGDGVEVHSKRASSWCNRPD